MYFITVYDGDDCADDPCDGDLTCRDDVLGFTCVCPEGTFGDDCECECNVDADFFKAHFVDTKYLKEFGVKIFNT